MLALITGCSKDNETPVIPQESEVTLFDKNSKAIAYIYYTDTKDTTIYMWDGVPVAYLENKNDVYHFDGRFLGWYLDGILYYTDGYAVAVTKDSENGELKITDTHDEARSKGVKYIKPIPHVKSLKPIPPIFKNHWSEISLTDFFYSEEK